MFIRIKPGGKYKYVEIVESYRDPVTKTSVPLTIQRLGRLDKLEEKDPEILEKLRAQVAEINQNVNKKKESEKRLEVEKFLSTTDGEETKEGYPEKNYGHAIYRKIWDEMNFDTKLKKLQKEHSAATYDLANITYLMVINRLLNPGSKLAVYKEMDNFLWKVEKIEKINLNHIYRSLDLLAANKEEIEEYTDKRIRKLYQRELDVAFYDVTTYAFESVETDGLKEFGYSKDKKFNEVQVVMGLLIDRYGIPLGYELFPGNTSDYSTLATILGQLKEKYKIKKIIITADRGLNSKNNLQLIKEMGFGYVMAYKIRGATEKIKKEVLDQEGYTWEKDTFRYKVYDYENRIKSKDGEVVLDEKLIVTWSETRRQKDEHDRLRLVEKAQKLMEKPGAVAAEMKKGGKKYLKPEKGKIQFEINYEQIEYDAQFDGYYGIETSEMSLSAAEIIEIYHGLWKIEESFRVLKTDLEVRPCFVWTEKRIKGHFVMCFIALTIQRILEYKLECADCHLSTAKIIAGLSSANLLVYSEKTRPIYLKIANNPDFDRILSAFSMTPLFSRNTRKDIRDIIALQI